MAAAPPAQTRRRRNALAVAAALALLFGAMAFAAASRHQRAMAYEFASTALLMLLVGGIVFLIQPSNRPGWRGAMIKVDTMRRLVLAALVLLGMLIVVFFLIDQMAGTLTAGIEVGIFGILLAVGVLYYLAAPAE